MSQNAIHLHQDVKKEVSHLRMIPRRICGAVRSRPPQGPSAPSAPPRPKHTHQPSPDGAHLGASARSAGHTGSGAQVTRAVICCVRRAAQRQPCGDGRPLPPRRAPLHLSHAGLRARGRWRGLTRARVAAP